MFLFLICQGSLGLRSCAFLFSERGGITYYSPGIFFWFLVFVGRMFHTKKFNIAKICRHKKENSFVDMCKPRGARASFQRA